MENEDRKDEPIKQVNDQLGSITFRQKTYIQELYRRAARDLSFETENKIAQMSKNAARNTISYLLEEIRWKDAFKDEINDHLIALLVDENKTADQRIEAVVQFCLMLRRR